MIKIDIDKGSKSESENSINRQRSTCSVSLWRIVTILCAAAVLILTIFILKTYIKYVLIWLEGQDIFVVSITVMFLFVLVSLPITIGYILLVVTTGYLFGFYKGLGLVILGANFGILVSHNVLKLAGYHRVIYKLTETQTAQAIKRVIQGPLSFKIVLCARLTPIPFGLQNTIFALSNVSVRVYHTASIIGLLPAQFIGVYFGSTLRSMHEVLDNKHISSMTYFVIGLQLILGGSLMLWIGTKAKQELTKALSEAENRGPKSNFTKV